MQLTICKGFFDDLRIRYIRRYKDGDKYVMIFMMLVGLAKALQLEPAFQMLIFVTASSKYS